MVLTDGKGSEREVLRTNYRAGVTYLLDRGYNDYDLFKMLVSKKAHFVTRMLCGAVYVALEDYRVSLEHEAVGIVSDQKIQLGQGHKAGTVRLVVYHKPNGTQMSYLTSRYDIDALTVVRMYDYRWAIEQFFAWIKLHLQVGHWYSENENGVLIQLYAALISFLLLKLYSAKASKVEHQAIRSEFVRYIARRLFERLRGESLKAYFEVLYSNRDDTPIPP